MYIIYWPSFMNACSSFCLSKFFISVTLLISNTCKRRVSFISWDHYGHALQQVSNLAVFSFKFWIITYRKCFIVVHIGCLLGLSLVFMWSIKIGFLTSQQSFWKYNTTVHFDIYFGMLKQVIHLNINISIILDCLNLNILPIEFFL